MFSKLTIATQFRAPTITFYGQNCSKKNQNGKSTTHFSVVSLKISTWTEKTLQCRRCKDNCFYTLNTRKCFSVSSVMNCSCTNNTLNWNDTFNVFLTFGHLHYSAQYSFYISWQIRKSINSLKTIHRRVGLLSSFHSRFHYLKWTLR